MDILTNRTEHLYFSVLKLSCPYWVIYTYIYIYIYANDMMICFEISDCTCGARCHGWKLPLVAVCVRALYYGCKRDQLPVQLKWFQNIYKAAGNHRLLLKCYLGLVKAINRALALRFDGSFYTYLSAGLGHKHLIGTGTSLTFSTSTCGHAVSEFLLGVVCCVHSSKTSSSVSLV